MSSSLAVRTRGARRARRLVLALVMVLTLACASAGTGPAGAADTRVTCVLPVAGADIVALARLPQAPWKPGHRGVDVAASVGDTVVAPAAGTVAFAGMVVDRPVLTIRHAGGLVTSLEPVDATVSVGEWVVPGGAVGTVAEESGHCAPATCVHWGLRLHGEYVDPLDYLAGFGEVVLLPVG